MRRLLSFVIVLCVAAVAVQAQDAAKVLDTFRRKIGRRQFVRRDAMIEKRLRKQADDAEERRRRDAKRHHHLDERLSASVRLRMHEHTVYSIMAPKK